MPSHHSGNRAGSNSSFHTSSTGAPARPVRSNPGITSPPGQLVQVGELRGHAGQLTVGLDQPDDRGPAEVDEGAS